MNTSHILIVEDEDELRSSLSLLLQTQGYRVSCAENGADGLRVVLDGYEHHDPVDLLITDLKMPVMSGMELVKVLHERHLVLPVIVITGHGGKQVMGELMRKGCVEYIEKPFHPDAVLSTVREVLEWEKQESEIKDLRHWETEKRLNFVIEAAREGIWDWHIQRDEVYVSSFCYAMLKGAGPEKEQLRFSTWRTLIPEDQYDEFMGCIQQHLYEEGEMFDHNITCYTGEKQRWLHFRGRVLMHTLDGRPLRMTGVCMDVTNRILEQQSLHKAREITRMLNETQRYFLSNLTHEIRTPINGVIGMLKLIRDEELCEPVDEYVNISLNSMYQLSRVVNGLLNLTTLEAGIGQKKSSDFSPYETMKKVCEGYVTLAAEGQISLEVMNPSEQDRRIRVNGDERHIRQALSNLVDNAVRFSDEGDVRVALFLERAENNNGYLVYTVIDQGIGIDLEMQELVFKPFFQVDMSYARRQGGLGIGLTISRRIAEKLGGSLLLKRTPDGGTMVRMSIPVIICADMS